MGKTAERMGSFYKGKKTLVTGGFGFIGSSLAVTLAQLGADVTVVDSLDRGSGANPFNLDEVGERVRRIISDVGNASEIAPALAGCDVIFNLAGEISHTHSIHNPERDLDLNARAQLSFLACCSDAAPRARIVYASSRQVY